MLFSTDCIKEQQKEEGELSLRSKNNLDEKQYVAIVDGTLTLTRTLTLTLTLTLTAIGDFSCVHMAAGVRVRFRVI